MKIENTITVQMSDKDLRNLIAKAAADLTGCEVGCNDVSISHEEDFMFNAKVQVVTDNAAFVKAPATLEEPVKKTRRTRKAKVVIDEAVSTDNDTGWVDTPKTEEEPADAVLAQMQALVQDTDDTTSSVGDTDSNGELADDGGPDNSPDHTTTEHSSLDSDCDNSSDADDVKPKGFKKNGLNFRKNKEAMAAVSNSTAPALFKFAKNKN